MLDFYFNHILITVALFRIIVQQSRICFSSAVWGCWYTPVVCVSRCMLQFKPTPAKRVLAERDPDLAFFVSIMQNRWKCHTLKTQRNLNISVQPKHLGSNGFHQVQFSKPESTWMHVIRGCDKTICRYLSTCLCLQHWVLFSQNKNTFV